VFTHALKKTTSLLIGILMIGGFGVLGYLVGEGFQQTNLNEQTEEIEKTETYVSSSQQNGIKINS
jgi:hypothetical protein